MEASLTHDAFTQNANTKFRVLLDENTNVELELVDVSEMKLYPQQEEFALEFRGPLNMFLGQGVRDFAHEQIGQFELFIVPIRQEADGFYYEAIFNRIREQSSE
jgi:hypothetical protein